MISDQVCYEHEVEYFVFVVSRVNITCHMSSRAIA